MKTAIHLHLYYMNQQPEIILNLKNMDKAAIDYDLYVTMSTENKQAEAEIKKEFPKAVIWQVENRGYDIGPFVDFLHKINLGDYDYILKLHTKNKNKGNYTILNNNRMDNALWGKVLFEALVGTAKQIKQNYAKFSEDDTIGMMGSKYCLTSEKHTYQSLVELIKSEAEKLHLPQTDKVEFVAGSMFLARAEMFKPFLSVSIDDFAQTDGRIKEGTKAHVYERLFGCAVLAQGKKIEGIKQYQYEEEFLKAKIKRFFFQKKETRSGHTIIKICKIPVLHLRSM